MSLDGLGDDTDRRFEDFCSVGEVPGDFVVDDRVVETDASDCDTVPVDAGDVVNYQVIQTETGKSVRLVTRGYLIVRLRRIAKILESRRMPPQQRRAYEVSARILMRKLGIRSLRDL